MPQDKSGQRTARRTSKGSAQTAAKPVPAKPVKNRVAPVAAKLATKSAPTKSVAKPATKNKLTKAVAKVVAKPAAAEKAAKPVLAAKPAKKRVKDSTAAQPLVLAPALEAVVESEEQPWIAAPVIESPAEPAELAEPWSDPGSVVEESVAPVEVAPADDPWNWKWNQNPDVEASAETHAIVDADVATIEASEAATVEATPQKDSAAAESGEPEGDLLFQPFTERRKTFRSLLERRLVNPSAKERRVASLASEVAADAAAKRPKTEAAAKERKARIVAASEDVRAAEFAAKDGNAAEAAPFVERRFGDRRAGGEVLEGGLRVREQQNLFNETAVWMRKSGAVLIGLNALVFLVVLVLWHSHPSQGADLKEMQKTTAAEMAEMRRATAASEVAAYASCLGSQTAQSILSQMKAAGAHLPPSVNSQQTAATRTQAAQIEFDVEKTTSVNVHVPVLFHLGVENTGKSSALNTKVWGAVKVLDSGKEPDFKYDDVALTKEAISPTDPETKLVLYTTDAGLVVPLKEEDYQRVSSGAAYVVAYGKTVYEDIYGARHWAEFCHAITEPIGTGKKHRNKCMAYNSTGVTDAPAKPIEVPRQPLNSASMTLPEIACQLPKQEKN